MGTVKKVQPKLYSVKRGRPLLLDSPMEFISLRLSAKLKAALEADAQVAGRTISQQARWLFDQGIDNPRLIALLERIDELAASADGPWARAIRVRCAEALGPLLALVLEDVLAVVFRVRVKFPSATRPVPWQMFQEILSLIARLRATPASA